MSGNSNVEDVRVESQAYYPVLLTCPHGGTVKVSPARKKSNYLPAVTQTNLQKIAISLLLSLPRAQH